MVSINTKFEYINPQLNGTEQILDALEQNIKEVEKKSACYPIEVVAKNVTMSFIGGCMFGNANKLALMTGIFYGASIPLSFVALKPLVNEKQLSKVACATSLAISAVAFKCLGLTNDTLSDTASSVLVPLGTIELLKLLNAIPNAFSSLANYIATKPSQETPQAETLTAQETPKTEINVKVNATSRELAHFANSP